MNGTISVILWKAGKDLPEKETFTELNSGRAAEVIEEEGCDRGLIWNRALKKANGDILVFLAEEAGKPSDELLDRLTAPFSDSAVTAVYGSAEAPEKTGALQKAFQRFFFSGKGGEKDRSVLPMEGIPAFLCSNVIAAYRASVFEKGGLFENRCLTAPEVLKAADMLYAGYKTVYVPEACVTADTLAYVPDSFKKAFLFGAAQHHYATVLGMDYVILYQKDQAHAYPVIQHSMKDYYDAQRDSVCAELKKNGKALAVPFEHLRAAFLKAADLLGRKYHRLPEWACRLFSGKDPFFC